MTEYNKSVSNTLTFTQSTGQGVNMSKLIEHIIMFGQQMEVNLEQPLTIGQVLDFYQRFHLDGDFASGDVRRALWDEITFIQSIGVARQVSLQDYLAFRQTISHNFSNHSLWDVLQFVQTIAYEGASNPLALNHELVFADDIGFNIEKQLSASNVLTFVQSILAYIDTDCKRFTWSGDENLRPSIAITRNFILNYSTDLITLPAPVFANREILDKHRISRKTRGGDLKLYIDDDWSEIETWRLQFQDLTDTQRSDVTDFMDTTLGLPIKVFDHESRVWTALILNPNTSFSDVERECGHTYDLELQLLSSVDAVSTAYYSHPAVSTEASVTVAEDTLYDRIVHSVEASYDDPVATGTLTVSLDGTVVRSIQITLGGASTYPWSVFVPKGSEVEVTLSAASGSTGTLDFTLDRVAQTEFWYGNTSPIS